MSDDEGRLCRVDALRRSLIIKIRVNYSVHPVKSHTSGRSNSMGFFNSIVGPGGLGTSRLDKAARGASIAQQSDVEGLSAPKELKVCISNVLVQHYQG